MRRFSLSARLEALWIIMYTCTTGSDVHLHSQLFVDQVLMRNGKTLHKGWLRYFGPRDKARREPYGERLWFVLRGRWLSFYETDLMKDSGVQLVCLLGCSVVRHGPRAISGKQASVCTHKFSVFTIRGSCG